MTSPTPETQHTPDVAKLLDRKPRHFLARTWDALKYDYGYLIFAALIPAIIVYLLYLVRGLYPFGEGSVLVLDLNGQYISFYEGLHNILHGDADLFYSFSRNLGGEFMGIYDYYVASPFALLLGLVPERYMLEGLLALFMLKAALCGLFMAVYLHKHSVGEPNPLAIIAFSSMYALCSYCIIQQHNSMWIDAVLWLPMLALGIEELIKWGKFRLYVFSLAIIIWSNFYIGYMVVIFTFVYCFYYYFAHNRNNENNPTGESWHFPKSVGRVLLWSVLGVGIAALVILTARYSLAFGKDEFSNPNWEIAQKFDLFEFFQKFLPSSYDTVKPSGRPIVYCGMLTVMLVPAFFMSKKFSMREKVAAALFILFFVISFATTTLDLVWHGFQKPNWLNYRYSFMLCFFLVVLAYRAFDQIKFTSRKSLLGAMAVIGAYVLLLPELADNFILKHNGEEISTSVIRPFATVWLALGCLAVYFILISLYGKMKERQKETVSIILVFVVCVELFLSGMMDMEELNTDVSYSKYSRYNSMTETFRPITYKIIEEDGGFYRTEMTYERKSNDSFALLTKGLSLSTSTLNRDTIDFLHDMGYDAKSHNSHYNYVISINNSYPIGTPVNDSLLGIKYLISERDYTGYYGDPIYTVEDYGYDEDFEPLDEYDVYLNPYALSLIYGVDSAWQDFNADDYSSPFARLNAMITAMLGEEETVQVFVPAQQVGEIELQNMKKDGTASPNHQKYSAISSDETAKMTITYKVPTDTPLYYHIPSLYFRETKVNGTSARDHIVPLGSSDTEEMTVEIKLNNSNNNVYFDQNADPSCVYYIDWEVFEDAMERLAKTQVTIEEGYTDSHLYGSVTTTEAEQMMFTSIPYDEGWHIYVDGEKVDIQKAGDALISFTIAEAGEHEIELRYMPRSLSLGLSISIVCGLIFVILLILYPFIKRVPILRALVIIPREAIPVVETPEMLAEAEPGDIGYERPTDPPDTPPAGDGTTD